MDYIFKAIGILGVILISVGIMKRDEIKEDFYFILGSLCLEFYSFYLRDLIFMILQIIVLSSALYEFIKLKKQKAK